MRRLNRDDGRSSTVGMEPRGDLATTRLALVAYRAGILEAPKLDEPLEERGSVDCLWSWPDTPFVWPCSPSQGFLFAGKYERLYGSLSLLTRRHRSRRGGRSLSHPLTVNAHRNYVSCNSVDSQSSQGWVRPRRRPSSNHLVSPLCWPFWTVKDEVFPCKSYLMLAHESPWESRSQPCAEVTQVS